MENFEPELRRHEHIESLQALEVVTKVTGNYTATYRDDIITADTSAGNITITLPRSRGGKHFTIVKLTAVNTLTVNFSAGELYLGAASVPLAAAGAVARLKAIPGGYIPI